MIKPRGYSQAMRLDTIKPASEEMKFSQSVLNGDMSII